MTTRGSRNWLHHGIRFGEIGDTAIITEGVEDALSVRLAGAECAIAVTGIANLKKLKLPKGTNVLMVRDGDLESANSTELLWHGLVYLIAEGHLVTMTPRP